MVALIIVVLVDQIFFALYFAANNITKTLESDKESDKIGNFCKCHRKASKEYCTNLKYPTCGGK